MFRSYLLLLMVVVAVNGCTATEGGGATAGSSTDATGLPDTSAPISTAEPTDTVPIVTPDPTPTLSQTSLPTPTPTHTPIPATAAPAPDPTLPPTATPVPAPLSNASVSFSDDFNGTELNSQNWVAIEGTGQIEVDNGAVRLSSSGETFPLVYARENPFPASGDFTVEISMRYLNVTERGVGVRLSSTLANYGAHQNLERDQLFEGRIIELWQDSANWHIAVGENNTEVYSLPAPELKPHQITINYIDGVYQVLLDGSEVYASNPTAERPTVLWFGNPAQVDSAGPWSGLEILAISVKALKQPVALAPPPERPGLESVSADGTCVAVDDTVTITSKVFRQASFEEEITSYLNNGGSIDSLATSLASAEFASEPILFQVVSRDVTASGIPDILMAVTIPYGGGLGETHVLSFTCDEGRYTDHLLFRRAGAGSRAEGLYEGGGAVVESLRDLNGNGRPDVVFSVNWPTFAEYYLLEWNGEAFASLIEYEDSLGNTRYSLEIYQGDASLADIDGDGIFEIIVTSRNGQTQTEETVIWQWDEGNYLYLPVSPTVTTVGQPATDPTAIAVAHPGWTTFTNANFVQDMTFDDQGQLWAATTGGVIKWDPTAETYTKYTIDHGLGSNDVQAVAVAPDGAMWFGTWGGGVSRFDGQTWITYTEADGLVDNRVNVIAVTHDGALWFGTPGAGVSRFDGQTWITYTEADGLADNYINAIGEALDGALWFGTLHGVSRFDGQSWTTYTEADGLADNDVHTIAVAPDGALWFGTWGSGVFHFDGQTWTRYTRDDGLVWDFIETIAVAPDGRLWVGTSSGVSYVSGQNWANYPGPDSGIQAITMGPDGRPWFGTIKGIFHFEGDGWTVYSDDHLAATPWVTDIGLTPDGTVWFGTERGVSRFDGETWTTYTSADGLAGDIVRSVAVAPDGVVWFGTNRGISRFDGETWTTYNSDDGLPSSEFRAIAVASDGTVWAGSGDPRTLSGGGVYRFDGQTWTNDNISEGSFLFNSVVAIAPAPDGTLWVGIGGGGGVAHFDGETWTHYNYTTYTDESGWGPSGVEAMAVTPDGILWVNSHNPHHSWGLGAYRFDGQTWSNYTTDDGLANNTVLSIAVDSEGGVWFGTNGGVSHFDGATWTTYTTADGLAGGFVSAIAVAPDGALWFKAGGGVSRYLPSD